MHAGKSAFVPVNKHQYGQACQNGRICCMGTYTVQACWGISVCTCKQESLQPRLSKWKDMQQQATGNAERYVVCARAATLFVSNETSSAIRKKGTLYGSHGMHRAGRTRHVALAGPKRKRPSGFDWARRIEVVPDLALVLVARR